MAVTSAARMLARAFRRAHWALKLLVLLGLADYLSQGLFLGLFSNSFDFFAYYYAAERVAHGRGASIYDAFLAYQPGGHTVFYMYPPVVALLVAPLGWLPPLAARLVFWAGAHAALWAAALLALSEPGLTEEAALLRVAALLLFQPVYHCLLVGQSETLVLLLLLAAARCWERDRDAAAGALLAVAVALKLFLLVALPLALVRRRWRLAGWLALWLAALLAAGLLVVPASVQAAYWSRLLQPLGIEAFFDNQSLAGFLHRCLAPSVYAAGFWDAPGLARALQALLSLVVLGVSGAAAARADRGPRELLGLAAVAALLCAPHADTHHQTLLLLPFWALLSAPPPPLAAAAFYAFFAEFVPLVAFRYADVELVRAVGRGGLALLFSTPFFALCAFWAYYVRSLARRRA